MKALARHLPLASVAIAASVLATAVWLSPGRAAPPVDAACPSPQDMPAGFDYPQPAPTIERWVAGRQQDRARAHGWNLWAALNTVKGGKPIWQSWCTETQAFAGQTKAKALLGHSAVARGERPMRQFKLTNGLRTVEHPINFPVSPNYPVPPAVMEKYWKTGCVLPPSLPNAPQPTLANGPTLQNNGDVMVAGVIYNKPAYDWIRSKALYQTATLERLLAQTISTPSIPAMPEGSIVLKPMMWPVKKSGFTALPVWDDLDDDHGVYSGFEIQSQWKRAVAVTPTPQSTLAPGAITYLNGVTMQQTVTIDGKPVSVAAPLGPNTYRNPKVVGVQQFYNYQPNLATMATCDRAILDASAFYAYGRLFEQGDYLVLVAMHVMTKEQPSWTFQSLWWHDKPDAGPYAANRPAIPGATGPWAQYLMTSTYGMADKPGGATWPIAYNPYIELAADHPIQTNCINCHKRAAWPNPGDGYEKPGGPGPLTIFRERDPKVFAGEVSVDSLWSLSDRVPTATR